MNRSFYLQQFDALPTTSQKKSKSKTNAKTNARANVKANTKANTKTNDTSAETIATSVASIVESSSKSDPARKLLFSKVLDRFFLCAEDGICTFTDFLDPYNRATFEQLLCGSRRGGHPNMNERDAYNESTLYLSNVGAGGAGVALRAYGGAPSNECERQMLGFAPSPEVLTNDRYPIARLHVAFNTKFHNAPRHKDLLGALLGLGIDRSRVGDIFLSSQSAEVLVHTEISEYIITQFTKAGKVPIKVTRAASFPLKDSSTNWDDSSPDKDLSSLTVASLRLDAVVVAAFRLSRSRAAALVAAEKVFVNWLPITDTGKILRENDCVTVRGQGRVHIVGIEGKTKKDRVRLTVAVLK